jgi:hypothetical protein
MIAERKSIAISRSYFHMIPAWLAAIRCLGSQVLFRANRGGMPGSQRRSRRGRRQEREPGHNKRHSLGDGGSAA